MIEFICIDFSVEEVHIDLDNGNESIIIGFEELSDTISALLAARTVTTAIPKKENN